MALYAIGDLQGCYDPFCRLLDRIGFDPARDRLWLTGDLVNRGPRSLAVLRFVKALGEAVTTVLGNHDLHLLALYYGASDRYREGLREVLEAPDVDELIDWLRHRPLLHLEGDLCLVHAGLPPPWDRELALRCAREVEAVLRGDEPSLFLRHMYGDQPDLWDEGLKGWARFRYIVNALTRMRYLDREGRLVLNCALPPSQSPEGLIPWFAFPGRRNRDLSILFGHWAALGFYRGEGVIGLDSGCVWGGRLTAVRLDGELEVYQVGCPRYAPFGK